MQKRRFNYNFPDMKILKPLTTTLSAILVLLIILTFVTPPIAKNYIVKHSKEFIGRQIQIQGLYLNIFTGYARITGFEIWEKDEQGTFVSFDTLSVDMSIHRLLANEIRINRIHLVNPRLKIWQQGSVFNFDDLMALGTDNSMSQPTDSLLSPEASTNTTGPTAPVEGIIIDTTSSVSSAEGMTIALYDISIQEGQIQYQDLIRNSIWGMDNFSLQIPGVYFNGKNTDVGIGLNFNDGGHLQTQIQYNLEANTYLLDIDLSNFSIAPVKPYLTDFLKINDINGLLTTHLNIEGNTRHVTDLNIRGSVNLRQLSLTDLSNKPVLATDSLSIEMTSINPEKAVFHFNRIAIDGLRSSFEMRPEGNTITDLLNTETTDSSYCEEQNIPQTASSETTKQPHFKIDTFRINRSLFVFEDKTLHSPFTFNLENINLKADGFSLDQQNKVKITSSLKNGGKISFVYEGKTDDISNTNLVLNIKNLDLKTFTPYSLQYFGYPLKKGILSFNSVNAIQNNILDGRNNLNIAKCEVDNKQKKPEPEYNIPLKTALYLIKDKDEQIKINLPVKGNINSPEFSYKKIIFKTLTNLLVKVAVSPIQFLAGSLGLSSDKLENLPFEATQNDFTPEQLTKINLLAEMLKAKPEMTLVMEQYVNLRQSKATLSQFYVKRNFYLRQHPEKTKETLQPIDYTKIFEMDTKDLSFLTYVREQVNEELKNASLEDQILSLTDAEQLEQLTGLLSQKRNQTLTEYLLRQGISDQNFRITTAPKEKLTQYTGKNLYTLKLIFEGDEPATDSPVTAEQTKNQGI